MQSQKRVRNDEFNVPILANKYDRFCTNCGNWIENAALEKFREQQCNHCFQTVEYRDEADGLWRRCVFCDVFNRCTFKHCYMCNRANVFYDEKKEKRLKAAALEKLRYLRSLNEDAGATGGSVSSPSLPKDSDSKLQKKSDPKAVNLGEPKVPDWQERFDRYCTNCGGVIINCALEKFKGQCCVKCKHCVEFRKEADGCWRRCVRCDSFLKCTFKYCYFCRRSNQYFDPSMVEKVRQEFEQSIAAIVDREEQEVIEAANELEKSTAADSEDASSKEPSQAPA